PCSNSPRKERGLPHGPAKRERRCSPTSPCTTEHSSTPRRPSSATSATTSLTARPKWRARAHSQMSAFRAPRLVRRRVCSHRVDLGPLILPIVVAPPERGRALAVGGREGQPRDRGGFTEERR